MSLIVGTRLGVYEVTGTLGVGGMGEVYRAHDGKLGRAVALKVLPEAFASDPDRLARFEREARTLASLNHPHIAQIYGLEEYAGSVALDARDPASVPPVRTLVMELVEGPTLAERIADGAVPLDEALSIAQQVADALEAAHDQGIVHRDLKPANIKGPFGRHGEGARFRAGEGDGRRGRITSRWARPALRAALAVAHCHLPCTADRRGNDPGHRRIHESGAGEGPSGRRAERATRALASRSFGRFHQMVRSDADLWMDVHVARVTWRGSGPSRRMPGGARV